ncbi:MAG: UDP-glucose/GDP-mannose dehydrogenase family protein [Synergistaceae bacterium]|jgi:UDPglucose 6-dehydrogenase|nr:UDP-glucose/GDP-mannose dehydrogenase family protein [Synergistaceae bacterium]
MKLVVIGSGYVGLVTGTCLARFGNRVVCVDTDERRVETLRGGEVPFYEPGLADMMKRNMKEGRLSFTPDTAEALDGADVCFITVGTPSAPDGSADLSYVEAAARAVGRAMKNGRNNGTRLLVVVKSTVPVGTNAQVRGWIAEELRGARLAGLCPADGPGMASNPEFLREGAAVRDFVDPDRVVIGTDSPDAEERMRELYSFAEPGKLLFMDIASAEMAKYAANAMLATRISFMNEMANICERAGANIDSVRQAMGLDTRIGGKFLYAGCGYGGSCFPKDVRAIRDFAASFGCVPRILSAVDEVNIRQKEVLYGKLAAHFAAGGPSAGAPSAGGPLTGGLSGRAIALWGLAFKPKTSDTREAPALSLIRRLLDDGARVVAHDPRAADETKAVLGERRGLSYANDPYEALDGADALVVATEWDIYKQPDFERVRSLLKYPVVVDGRNLYALSEMRHRGFDYYSIGRPAVLAASRP